MFNNFECKVLGLPLLGLMIIPSPWPFSWAKYVAYESVWEQERGWIAIVFACALDKVPAVLLQNGTPGKSTAKSSFWGFQQPQRALSGGSALPLLLFQLLQRMHRKQPRSDTLWKPSKAKCSYFPSLSFGCVTVFNSTLAEMGSVVRNLCIWVFILTVQG